MEDTKDLNKADAEFIQKAIADYLPGYAGTARDLIIKYLGRHDPEGLREYLGEEGDGFGYSLRRRSLCAGELLIRGMLENDEEQDFDPYLMDYFIRHYLDLPPLVITNDSKPLTKPV